jgi:hypothetical protein
VLKLWQLHHGLHWWIDNQKGFPRFILNIIKNVSSQWFATELRQTDFRQLNKGQGFTGKEFRNPTG